ncbi:unnamed protein product [Anisakis simplex]|uniref:Serine/threonine-protein kinase ULK3 n=1 Tax=Anisakis simplex TaxID=6269 RepID=A0A3P6RL49_ANISI|nr:unnamed protein product [Anisakis simplex]
MFIKEVYFYRIGGGSFSTVYKGISKPSSKTGVPYAVAIKCMDMKFANSSKLNSDCVVSEISILKRLKHRNIVRLHDFEWDKKNIYLIMEYCGGGDLSRLIREYGQLSELITRRLFRQIASALFYMRGMNIAHMDLKPQNILLTSLQRPFIKVSDFGLSQYLKNDESASSFRGSPLYMAPEIFTRQKYDSRVDLWSSGIILYECLYGKPPFTAESYERLIEQILSYESIKFPSNVQLSFDCLDLLQGLLVRNPHHRIEFKSFFAHPFVDLTKLPSSNQLTMADEDVLRAKQLEANGNIIDAVKRLTNAIQLYMGCLELFDSDEEKCKFREKIKNLLEYAERLKDSLKPVQRAEFQPNNSIVIVTNDWPDYPQVDAAMLLAKTAKELEVAEKWSQAYDKYMLAIEGSMKVLKLVKEVRNDNNMNSNNERITLLRRKISQWLSSAERINVIFYLLFIPLFSLSHFLCNRKYIL